MSRKLSARVIIPNKRGLHARASAKIVEAAARFQSQIYVIKDGTTVEEGTHAELIGRENGIYRTLSELQQLDLAPAE